MQEQYDNVNYPKHYTTGKYECIDVLEDWMTYQEFKGFLKGNVLKYIHRYKYKNGLEDLKKAQWYLNKLIETSEKDQNMSLQLQKLQFKDKLTENSDTTYKDDNN